MHLLFLIALLLASSATSQECTSTSALNSKLDLYQRQWQAINSLPDSMEDIRSLGRVSGIYDLKQQFEQANTGARLDENDPVQFIVTPINLYVKLTGPTNAKISDFMKQCNFLNGKLFEPTPFTDQELLAKLEEHENRKIRIPIYLNDTDSSNKRIVSAVTNKVLTYATAMNFPDTISNDKDVGMVLSLPNPTAIRWETTEANVKKITTALCVLISAHSERMQEKWATFLRNAINENDATLISKLNDKIKQIQGNKICRPLPKNMISYQPHMALNELEKMKTVEDIPTLQTLSDMARKLHPIFENFLNFLNDRVTEERDNTYYNHGDWTKMEFNPEEAEEQIIMLISGIWVLTTIIFSSCLYCIWKKFKTIRHRHHLRQQYPNVNDMPLVERASLL